MKISNKKNRGFSLMELLIAMAVFMIIVLATISAFASVIKSRKVTRQEQTKLEAARSVMESWSKNCRMSQYADVVPAESIWGTEMHMFNGSQGACIAYRLDLANHRLEMSQFSSVSDPETECSNMASYTSWQVIMHDVTDGIFKVATTKRTPGDEVIGRSTFWIKIGNSTIQTSVSFRDYTELL